MTKKIVMTVSGIRPDFIRMSEVFKRLDEAEWCEHVLVHTGQHYDKHLSDVFFEDLQIREPDYNLLTGVASSSHYDLVAKINEKLIPLAHKINPDIIIFLGDSNSVLTSLYLKKEGFKICHIEAGMRSGDMRMLEEINRKSCDMVSDILFVYHKNYKQKALKEGIDENKIKIIGNTIIEPLTKIADLFYLGNKKHILLDIHRPENFKYKDRLEIIIKFSNFCIEQTQTPVKLLKFNRTLEYLNKFNINLGKIETIDLMGYKQFIKFMQDSAFIISDSGTAQEEPALLQIPVIVPRDFTERPESIENNCSQMLKLTSEDSFFDLLRWAQKGFNGNSSWLGEANSSSIIEKNLKDFLNG